MSFFKSIGMKLGLIQPDIQRPTSPRQQQRKRQDPRKSLPVEELARRLRMTPEQLAAFEPSYNEVQIPKKRGGMRKLCVPDAATKSLQRKILHMVLMLLKTHDAATGFDPGVSIAHNAAMHVGQAVVIKLDIKDFFPSTTSLRVEQYFLRIGWNAEAAALLVRLVTYDGGLPQGAPTSPRLSNLVNYTLDCKIMDYVQRHRGTYTRYADDITVSYPEDWPKYVRGTVQRVRSVCRKFDYVVHTRGKLRILRAHQQQRVTGLVVNEKVQLPREKRRWLRAVEHRLRTTGEASLTEEQLAGWQGLQDMIAKQTTPIDNER